MTFTTPEPAGPAAPQTTLPTGQPAGPNEPGPPIREVGGRHSTFFTVFFIVAFFANMMAVVTPSSIAISLKVLQIAPNDSASAQSVVLGVGAVFAALANPIGGYFSDRSTSRLGRRRPYLLIGAVIGFAGLAVLAASATVPLLIIGWAIAQTGFNIVFAALYGLLADAFPARARGRMSGFIGLGQAIGIAGGTAVANIFPNMLALTFLVPGVVALVLVGFTAIIAPDRRQEPHDLPPSSMRSFLTGFWVSPRKYPDYGWAWLGRFCMIFAQSAAGGFTVLFLVYRFGYTPQSVTSVVLVNTMLGLVVQAIASPLGGWLSDRFQRRKAFVFLSASVFTIGIVIIMLAGTITMFYFGSIVLGLGVSSYIAIDLALVTDVLPEGGKDAGKHLGVLALANTIPQSLAPAMAPLFLSIGGSGENYDALFIASAIVAICGAISVFFIKGVR